MIVVSLTLPQTCAGTIDKKLKVVVVCGAMTAFYTSGELLGGGINACVDSQEEYNNNVRAAAEKQFRRDCVLAVGGDLYEVSAGRYDGHDRDYKVIDSFATRDEVFEFVEDYKLRSYPFCVVKQGDKEWDIDQFDPVAL